jgi:hypothetical protein
MAYIFLTAGLFFAFQSTLERLIDDPEAAQGEW